MTKHIIGQAIYQVTVLLILVFAGDTFLPEFEDSFDDEIKSGRYPASYKYSMNGNKNRYILILKAIRYFIKNFLSF